MVFGYWVGFVAIGVGGVNLFGAEFLDGWVAGQFIFFIDESIVVGVLIFSRLFLVLVFEFGQIQGSIS